MGKTTAIKKIPIDWKKHHRFMVFSGWCGQTTLQIILSACGIKKSAFEISRYVYKKWYGSPFILLVAYLKRYFTVVNYKTGATIADISGHIKLGHIVIVNFWDTDDDDNGDGHYAIVESCQKGKITFIDSSKEHDWRWSISTKKFTKIWYDYLTNDNELYHTGLMIWVAPSSKK